MRLLLAPALALLLACTAHAAGKIPGTTGLLPYVDPLPNPVDSPLGVVVVDPGHGTMDSAGTITGQGASAQLDGREIPEQELTLDYGMHLVDALRRVGVETYTTRSYGRPWFRVDYRGHDQEENNRLRAQFAADHGAALFVRLHFDGSEEGSDSGFSLWFNDQSRHDADGSIERESLAAAKAVNARLARAMALEALGIRSFDRPIYGFVHARQPSILLELGYLSNEDDARYLLRESTLKAATAAAAGGIVDYLSSKTGG